MAAESPRSHLRKRLQNALTLLRQGSLTPPYRAPYEVVFDDPYVSLRAYTPADRIAPGRGPILLVPPLMVTSEIYDISPELSAVAYLAERGVPTYVADFGAPEATEGGLDRTLDDHVLAVSRCVDLIRELHGDVHLVGYSQGGMFCYQTAAYRQSAGIASLVTFGSPVDLRRNAPFGLNEKVAEKLISGLRLLIDCPLEGLRGLSGAMSSRGFKLMAPLQELRHLVQLFGVLHDEEALAKIEPKRRFLGGEGFIAWPGPALRAFIDQFVVENRMKEGGFVIAGRTVALADITNPICYLVGEDDDLALPEAVQAIRVAAARATTYPVHVRAGHFGLVVGRAAMTVCWPTVLAWSAWHDGLGERPAILDAAGRRRSAARDSSREVERDRRSSEQAGGVATRRRGAVGHLVVRLAKLADAVRWQLPLIIRRALMNLDRTGSDEHIAPPYLLRARANEAPDAICFLFAGGAFTFREALERFGETPLPAPLTNRTWFTAALDLAIAARLTSADTIYCPLALAPAAIAVCMGAALIGGARVQLADHTHPAARPMWQELLNSGATVVIAGDAVARLIADAPRPERHTVRLVLGDALSSEVASALADRLGVRTRYRTLHTPEAAG